MASDWAVEAIKELSFHSEADYTTLGQTIVQDRVVQYLLDHGQYGRAIWTAVEVARAAHKKLDKLDPYPEPPIVY